MVRWMLLIVVGTALLASCSTLVDETPTDSTTTTVGDVTTATTPETVTTTTEAPTTTPASTSVEPEPSKSLPRDATSGVVALLWPREAAVAQGLRPPLIVLVPGGGWITADPTGLMPLAEELADAGAIVAPITYRAANDNAFFPIPAQDVACAVAHATATVRAAGHEIGDIVVVGHSSGAHLGALVSLRPLPLSAECEDPAVAPDRFIGLAGPYDVVQAQRFAIDLFGPDNSDPTRWSEGNPLDHADQRLNVAVLLIHGTSDRTVPVYFTEAFAAALTAGGHHIDTAYPQDADHHTIYSPEIAAPIITQWLGL